MVAMELPGMIVSHVDDLWFGGDAVAEAFLMSVGKELGFREVSAVGFTWCGKQFTRKPDGIVALSMGAYHRNPKPILAVLTCRCR